jgi:hypothetical protein
MLGRHRLIPAGPARLHPASRLIHPCNPAGPACLVGLAPRAPASLQPGWAASSAPLASWARSALEQAGSFASPRTSLVREAASPWSPQRPGRPCAGSSIDPGGIVVYPVSLIGPGDARVYEKSIPWILSRGRTVTRPHGYSALVLETRQDDKTREDHYW